MTDRQGREKEAIIISMVRSNANRTVGFLADKRRMNVAVGTAVLPALLPSAVLPALPPLALLPAELSSLGSTYCCITYYMAGVWACTGYLQNTP